MRGLMMSDAEKNYITGYNLSLDFLDELDFKTKGNPTSQHFTGMLACLFEVMYVHQPKELVDEVIFMAQEFAIYDSEKE